MTIHRNRLYEIIELLRKDTAINNSIDAVEQLSLLLIIKYLYEHNLIDRPMIGREHFFDYFFNGEMKEINFYTLRDFIDKKTQFAENFKALSPESWNTIEKLLEHIPFRIRSEKVLKRVSSLLSKIDIFDNLKQDFDEVLSMMVIDSKASGAFYSPKPLIDALVMVSKPSYGQRIYDPAMGTGRSFIAINEFLSPDFTHDLDVTGNDSSPFACLVGILNLLLNNINIRNISLSDSLLIENTTKYDFIISAFPFGISNDVSKYEYAYNGYQGSLEAMFLKHTMDKLAENGRAAVVVPEGILFSSTNQLIALRHKLLTEFNLHTILSLPQGSLSPYTNIKVSVLFFDKDNSGTDIFLYDMATNRHANKLQPLCNEDFSQFISLFDKRENSERSMLVPKESFLKHKIYSLSHSFYKEEAPLFDKLKLIKELRDEESNMVRSLQNYFETLARDTKVSYSDSRKIESFGKFRTGENLNKAELLDSGVYAVYGGNGTIGYFDKANRSANTIIIGKVGLYCGNIHYSTDPFWLTSNAISLEITDTSNIFAPYIVHLLRGLDLNKLSTGTVQKFISIKQLNDIEVSLPSYEKQVELSNWFSKLEDEKRAIQRSISDVNEKLQSITDFSIMEKVIQN
jgi:type I restriction enzyme M protein